jgi:HD domain-containing protein
MTDGSDGSAVKAAEFIYEMGFLKQVKRAGWSLVGISGPETVAEHSFRALSSDSSWHRRRAQTPHGQPSSVSFTIVRKRGRVMWRPLGALTSQPQTMWISPVIRLLASRRTREKISL